MKKVFDKVSRFLTKDHVDKHYELKQELGSGNFSIVRKGVNRLTGEEVAVKIIEKKRVGQKKEMIQTELDILQKVKHPNVVELKEMFETPTHIYLVMEIVTGGELFDRIVDRGSFSEQDACRIAKEILESVEYLHSLGIAHRDLKPENLLCTSRDLDMHVKLSDFGLSKIMSTAACCWRNSLSQAPMPACG
jgi:calcium/calmodulin-dependent protein kinase I